MNAWEWEGLKRGCGSGLVNCQMGWWIPQSSLLNFIKSVFKNAKFWKSFGNQKNFGNTDPWRQGSRALTIDPENSDMFLRNIYFPLCILYFTPVTPTKLTQNQQKRKIHHWIGQLSITDKVAAGTVKIVSGSFRVRFGMESADLRQ